MRDLNEQDRKDSREESPDHRLSALWSLPLSPSSAITFLLFAYSATHMPSLLKETHTPDVDSPSEMVVSRDAEDRIDARLHPANDVRGGRPTTRFVESPQKQKINVSAS